MMTVFLIFIGMAAIALLTETAVSKNMIVGGANKGWDLGNDLQSWASSQTFAPGDTLTFFFDSFHNVVEVPKADFDACTVSNRIQSYTGGTAVIKLSFPGKRYFICGVPGHCSQGMKMKIDVASASRVIPTFSSPPSVNGLSLTPTVPAHAPTMSLDAPNAPTHIDGPTNSPPSIPAIAPVMPSVAPIAPPPVTQLSEKADPPSSHVSCGDKAGIVLLVSFMMVLAF